MYVEDCFLLSDTADVRIFLKAGGGGGIIYIFLISSTISPIKRIIFMQIYREYRLKISIQRKTLYVLNYSTEMKNPQEFFDWLVNR